MEIPVHKVEKGKKYTMVLVDDTSVQIMYGEIQHIYGENVYGSEDDCFEVWVSREDCKMKHTEIVYVDHVTPGYFYDNHAEAQLQFIRQCDLAIKKLEKAKNEVNRQLSK